MTSGDLKLQCIRNYHSYFSRPRLTEMYTRVSVVGEAWLLFTRPSPDFTWRTKMYEIINNSSALWRNVGRLQVAVHSQLIPVLVVRRNAGWKLQMINRWQNDRRGALLWWIIQYGDRLQDRVQSCVKLDTAAVWRPMCVSSSKHSCYVLWPCWSSRIKTCHIARKAWRGSERNDLARLQQNILFLNA